MKADQSECLILVLLLLHRITVSRSDRFEVLGPSKPVVAVAGQVVVLPCRLRSSISAENYEIRWFRKDFTDIVHLYHNLSTITENQYPFYSGRTALFPEEIKKGNVSLRLTAVKGSDGGRYTCFVQFQDWYDDWTINVIIKGTKPVISIDGFEDGGIRLLCECKDWYPDTELVWLDSEGHSLTAGPTETDRSEDGSIILRRSVIVQQRSNKRFICQIQQLQLGLVTEVDIKSPAPHLCPWAFGLFTLGVILVIISLMAQWLKEQRWEQRQRCAVDVNLDPDTAHPCLILSEDGKEMRRGDTRQDLPDNPKRFTSWWAVLGKEEFTSGTHYWEVQVSERGRWGLGVAGESENRRDDIRPCLSEGYWCIERRYTDVYWALTDISVSFHLRQKPHKVGVYVDYEGGQISFYNVEAKSHIFSFRGQRFTGKLYPYFDNYEPTPLIITPVSHTG